MDNYDFAIEELHLSGTVGLGRCSASTVYRWAHIINDRLKTQHIEWRVKPDIKGRALYAVAPGSSAGD